MKQYEADDPLRIEDMTKARPYGLVRAFLQTALSRLQKELEQPSNTEHTAALRGEIRALRLALEAPAHVIREIREAERKGKVTASE